MLSDMALLERYSKMGDAEAFAELIRRYAGMVYGACLRVTASAQTAEDVAQECFLELARKAGMVKSSVPGWLHKVARFRSVDAIRKDVVRRRHEEEALTEANSDAGDAGWAEIAPLIDEALEKLPKRLREPVILHYLQGLTQAEVARQMGVSQPTTSRNLDRAITFLRAELKRAGVVVTVGALAALLTDNAVTAAPAAVVAALGKIAISGIGAGVGTSAGVLGGITAFSGSVLGTLAGKVVMVSAVLAVSLTMGLRMYGSDQTKTEPAVAQAPGSRSVPATSTVRYDQLGFQVDVPYPYKKTTAPPGPGSSDVADLYVHDGIAFQVSVAELGGGKPATATTFLDMMMAQFARIGGTVAPSRTSVISGYGIPFDTASGVAEAEKGMFWLSERETIAGSRARTVFAVAQLPNEPSRVVLLGVSGSENRGAEVQNLGTAFVASFNRPGANPNAGSAAPVQSPIPPELRKGEIALQGTVESIAKDAKSLELLTDAVTLYGQDREQLVPPRHKTVLLDKLPEGVATGRRIVVVGQNSGSGKPIKPRLIELEAPPQAAAGKPN